MAEFEFSTLVKFLQHADNVSMEGYLRTNGFPKSYGSLIVDLSFGAGNPALVPWIAFLGYNQKTQQGIYPVYLYYKSWGLLILAYGVSATKAAKSSWVFKGESPLTIKEYFAKNSLGDPKKYKESYVYKSYSVDPGISNYGLKEEIVNLELKMMIDQFHSQFRGITDPIDPLPEDSGDKPTRQDPDDPSSEDFIQHFTTAAHSANYRIPPSLAVRYIASLLTKPFVILTGLSGSGKTKLAQLFAQWICASKSQYCLVPVGADWTNREPLLGYPNALDASQYISPDNGALALMIEAGKNQNKPYFLILDEMNMSHVERYFADFLSAMESREAIPLHSGKQSIQGIPSELKLPRNLFIIGTVNVDETTYMFSPKVLDRANVIEFRVSGTDMQDYLAAGGSREIKDISKLGEKYASGFMKIRELSLDRATDQETILMQFFDELKKIGAEFGYRTASEISRFLALMKELDKTADPKTSMDFAILQKLLPKVHGSRRKLEPVLKKLADLCLENKELLPDLLSGKNETTDQAMGVTYPQALEKILRMYRSMIDNGFTSFTEA